MSTKRKPRTPKKRAPKTLENGPKIIRLPLLVEHEGNFNAIGAVHIDIEKMDEATTKTSVIMPLLVGNKLAPGIKTVAGFIVVPKQIKAEGGKILT